jgi:protoheme ferro-lyase
MYNFDRLLFLFLRIHSTTVTLEMINESKNRLGYTELKSKNVDEYTASEMYVKQVLERIREAEKKDQIPHIILDLNQIVKNPY